MVISIVAIDAYTQVKSYLKLSAVNLFTAAIRYVTCTGTKHIDSVVCGDFGVGMYTLRIELDVNSLNFCTSCGSAFHNDL